MTSWLPTYRDGTSSGWTLEFMRRRPDGMNGVMEFLIASMALRSQEDGVEFVSLSVAPLAVSGDRRGGGAGCRPCSRPSPGSLEPAYGFRSLAAFKQKFQPELQPLVLAYPDPVSLPAIGVAVARAYLPDLSRPTRAPRRRPR